MQRAVATWRRVFRHGRTAVATALVVLVSVVVAAPAAAYPVDPDWAEPRTVFIPETGQSLDRLFLDLWRGNGGESTWGNPLTPEITLENGHVIQYFEFARFEYWPEGDANGNTVVLGDIGEALRPLSLDAQRESDARAFSTLDIRRQPATPKAEQAAWEPFASVDDIDFSDDASAYRQNTYRFVPETGHGVWGGFRDWWESSGEAGYLGNPLTEEYVVKGVSYQVFERGKLTWKEGQDIRLMPVGEMLVDRYTLDTSPMQQGDLPVYNEEIFIPPIAKPAAGSSPGPVDGAGKSIVISLSQQAMWAYEGSTLVDSIYVSTGREKFKTPTGLYAVNLKMKLDDMDGIIGGEEYDVPNVPDVMYFTDRGHAIHGAYWHENFGNPMSHGCVNLPLDISKWLYDWAPVGTPVLIVQ